jgi:signal transduction histidine kinase
MKILFNKNSVRGSDPFAPKVTSQAIQILFKTLPGMQISVLLMMLIMQWVMWTSVDHMKLIIWGVFVVITAMSELLLGNRYFTQKRTNAETKRWGRYYSVISIASGLTWGSACVLFFVSDSSVLQVFLFTSIVGIATASIIQHSYWLESYYAFTVPLLTLSGLRLYWEGNIAYQGLALLTFILLAIVIQMAHESHKSVFDGIRLRFENLALVERLREEKEKAEAASRDKTRFLASASHDLRQPVHALTLFADALYPEVPGEKGKVLLSNVGHSIDALNQLLESLLDISKLDANIVKPNPEHFALRPLLETLQAEYLPQVQAKGLLWKLDLMEDLVVHSDPVLLGTMLRNLISNAIRYTNSGTVAIACKRSDKEVKIEIIDTGIGIPHDQQSEIFREFYQLTNPERDRSKGLGLGLAIVDRLALLLHHRIELNSEYGMGSCFTIVLEQGDQAAVLTQEDPHPYMGSRDVYGMRLVVIDDEQAVREGMRAVLENWGCEVVLAASDDDAVDKLGDCPPHVIVADYRLRETKTGAQAIERLRKVFGREIPALIITGDTGPERLREAQDSGHTLMHKPVQPAKLRAYLRSVQRRKA